MPPVTTTTDDALREVRLDRPKVNALDPATLHALAAAVEAATADDGVRGVLFLGAGRCFSAGLDLNLLVGCDAAGVDALLVALDRALEAIFRCPKPVAVAVEGHAIAGGMVLALAADHLVLGTGDYRLGLTELKVGVPFPRTAFEIVHTALPPRGARRFVYEAGLLPPQHAYGLGAGDALDGEPVAAARAWLQTVTARPAVTFAWAKRQLREAAWDRIDARRDVERPAVAEALLSPPVRAALEASLAR